MPCQAVTVHDHAPDGSNIPPGIFFAPLRTSREIWYNVRVNKSKDRPAPPPVAEEYVRRVKERCAKNCMTVTLWLLFDTAADRDGNVRDRMLRQFKAYAKCHGVPRSVSEGARWLAEHWVVPS